MVDGNHPFSKIRIFLPCIINAKIEIEIHHSTLRIFQKFRMDWNSNFVRFILLVKLRYNRDRTCGLN
jgi:hypothetical protein